MLRKRYEKRIRDYTIEALMRRLLKMEPIEKETERLLFLLASVPKEESKVSFDIKATKGFMEGYSIKNNPDFAVDVLRLDKGTTTESTAAKRTILFKPIKGSCVIQYASKNKKYERVLSKSQALEIDKNAQFKLCTNGVGCDLILLLGEV